MATTNLTDEELSRLNGAALAIKNSKYSVATISNLPAASENSGRMVYVEDINAYRFSDGASWINDYNTSYSVISSKLYTWGRNNRCQLGDGTTTDRSSPGTTAGGGIDWCFTSSGYAKSAAIKTDGTLWTWGGNANGQLGDGTTTYRASPVTTAGGGTNWCLVSMGRAPFGGAIKTDGTLWTWGSGWCGSLGNGTTTSRSSPGTTAGGGTNWCTIQMGAAGGIAIKTDGTLWTWGCNYKGELGNGTTTSRSSPGTTVGGGTNWCAATLMCNNAAAIKTDGTLWTWGAASYLGNEAAFFNGCRSSPGTTAGGGTNWYKVCVGGRNASAIKTDGTLWTWGGNNRGELGDGTTTSRSSPVTTAGGGTNWCSISVGNNNSAAIKTNGTLWTWGYNNYAQLGDGTTTSRSSPVTIAGGGFNWKMVSVGAASSSAIEKNITGF